MKAPHHRQNLILANLPITLVGVALVVFALLEAAWPPDFVAPLPVETVSHWERMTGNDMPANRIVERREGYAIRRGIDALAYYTVFQSVVAVVGLAWSGDRNMYVLLVISGLFGVAYAASLGIIIGPLIAAVGYALILWSGIFGMYSTVNWTNRKQQLQPSSIGSSE